MGDEGEVEEELGGREEYKRGATVRVRGRSCSIPLEVVRSIPKVLKSGVEEQEELRTFSSFLASHSSLN